MGGNDIRERYLMGAEFAKDVRALSPRTFRDVVGTYGPRSYRYAEMVFGNIATVQAIRAAHEQEPIYAMRANRDLSMADIRRATGLTPTEIQRFNPAHPRTRRRARTMYRRGSPPSLVLTPDWGRVRRRPPGGGGNRSAPDCRYRTLVRLTQRSPLTTSTRPAPVHA